MMCESVQEWYKKLNVEELSKGKRSNNAPVD